MATETEPLRTPEQMVWIRERFKPDGLQRLARSTPDYYEQKGSYLPDVAALAYAEWQRAEQLEVEVRRHLWLNHGCEFGALYGDDGEMQCGACLFDFRRAPIADVRRHALLARAAAAHVAPGAEAGGGEGAGGEGDEDEVGGVHSGDSAGVPVSEGRSGFVSGVSAASGSAPVCRREA